MESNNKEEITKPDIVLPKTLDNGGIQVQVKVANNKVLINFANAVKHIWMEPKQAAVLANSIKAAILKIRIKR